MGYNPQMEDNLTCFVEAVTSEAVITSLTRSDMQLLNRADNLRDFVLRGEKSGQIDIWVRNRSQRDVRITRELNKERNTSDWRINGEQIFLCISAVHVSQTVSWNVQPKKLRSFR